MSQLVLPPLTPSDFDIRNSIAGAVSYEVPAPPWGRVANAILKGWAVDGLLRLSSAPPIDVTVGNYSPVTGPYQTTPDVVPGQPFWIADSTQSAGRALNPAAFVAPPPNQPGTGQSPQYALGGPRSAQFTIKLQF